MPNTHDGNDELHALMPVDTSNQRIIWDNNPASIDLYLKQVNLWSVRTNKFKPLFAQRAVSYRGKLYIEDAFTFWMHGPWRPSSPALAPPRLRLRTNPCAPHSALLYVA